MSRCLVILARTEHIDLIDDCLARAVGPRWKELGTLDRIGLTLKQRHSSADVQSLVTTSVQRIGSGEILLVGDLAYTGSYSPTDTTTVRKLRNLDNLRVQLPRIVESNGLDLVTERASYLSGRWETRHIERQDIQQWLAQFSELGDFEWIGRGVLAGLSCLSTSEMVTSLGLEKGAPCDRVCYFAKNDGPAESSIALAHAISKSTNDIPVLHLDRELKGPLVGRSMLIEDCSISGKQFLKFSEYFWPDGRNSPEDLRLVNLDIRFPILTNAARMVINKRLLDYGLANVILQDSFGRVLDIVTPAGLSALEKGEYYSVIHKTARRQVFRRRPLFEDVSLWGSMERAKSAERFLAALGEKLYEVYVREHNIKTHTKSWIKEAGLGAGGFGLTIVLARSVPKSSLPVLWAAGRIRKGSRVLEWRPLFSHSSR